MFNCGVLAEPTLVKNSVLVNFAAVKSNSSASVGYFFPVTMRANPTMAGTGLSLNRFTANQNGAVSQMGTTSGATAYSLTAFTASAEL